MKGGSEFLLHSKSKYRNVNIFYKQFYSCLRENFLGEKKCCFDFDSKCKQTRGNLILGTRLSRYARESSKMFGNFPIYTLFFRLGFYSPRLRANSALETRNANFFRRFVVVQRSQVDSTDWLFILVERIRPFRINFLIKYLIFGYFNRKTEKNGAHFYTYQVPTSLCSFFFSFCMTSRSLFFYTVLNFVFVRNNAMFE